MLYVLLACILVLLILGPNLWATHVIKKHSIPRPDLTGSGGEFAEHLIERFQLTGVTVESTLTGDHYDPLHKKVRLGDENLKGRSLSAIAIAAHEVGHAIQHHQGYRPLLRRNRLAGLALQLERIGSAAFVVAPIVTAVVKSPMAGLFMVGIMVFSLLVTTLVHLVTLPVEWDASFGKALPILAEGGYLSPADQKNVRTVLTACALTYVASSLAGLLNLWRWLRILRR